MIFGMKSLMLKLKSIREASNISMGTQARQLGFSENYLYRLTSGNRQPGLPFIKAVLKAYPGLEDFVIGLLKGE